MLQTNEIKNETLIIKNPNAFTNNNSSKELNPPQIQIKLPPACSDNKNNVSESKIVQKVFEENANTNSNYSAQNLSKEIKVNIPNSIFQNALLKDNSKEFNLFDSIKNSNTKIEKKRKSKDSVKKTTFGKADNDFFEPEGFAENALSDKDDKEDKSSKVKKSLIKKLKGMSLKKMLLFVKITLDYLVQIYLLIHFKTPNSLTVFFIRGRTNYQPFLL